LSLDEFNKLQSACAPPVTWNLLHKIADKESGLNPLAIHDNTTGKSYSPPSRDQAVTLSTQLISAGHSVDSGLMQINSANLDRLDLSIDAAFDPCHSIEAGAKILSLISTYNTGNDRGGFKNGYVRKVVDGSPRAGVAQEPEARSPRMSPAAPEVTQKPAPHQWHDAANHVSVVRPHEWVTE